MPWYLYLAFKQLFPSGRWMTFFTCISTLGVFLGVWMLIIIIGVMSGFGFKYGRMIIDTGGEIQVRGAFIENPERIQEIINKVPGVVASTPTAEGIVMIEHQGRPGYPGIIGVAPESVEKVIPISKYLREGSMADLDDDAVVLSAGLAASISTRVGSKVTVVSPLTLERLSQDAYMMPTELTVAGVYEFGHQQLDKSVAIVTLRRMQDLYGLGEGAYGVNVRIAPDADVDAIAGEINASLPPGSRMRARTWMQSGEAFLFALKIERLMIILIVSMVVFVVAFLVTAMLLVAVAHKTREIGLYGALGASPWQSAMCFCFQGVIVGVIGTALGVSIGLLTLANIDPIARLIARLTGNWELLVEVYEFTKVPAHITGADIAIICAFAIGMSTLAGLVAAWRAAKLKPVEAMRSE
ncbi:lipoprotein-releasing system permease protein [Ereboglobus sp. PH5-10]|uniref:ABC transporter permease n=1 Tax=Ereboglobus sp. PH5-10 TaxID=2940629 RepID=UPI00240702F8|nr:ABC transporter permease [Ereboglobus sp. PH5-10]MDF9827326.1 lipoprotein-releasing system permease protein [Ereboglobus sp. PH5-10]